FSRTNVIRRGLGNELDCGPTSGCDEVHFAPTTGGNCVCEADSLRIMHKAGQCPTHAKAASWSKSSHFRISDRCPLFPQNQTSGGAIHMTSRKAKPRLEFQQSRW